MSNLPISEDFPSLHSAAAAGKQKRGSTTNGRGRNAWSNRQAASPAWFTNDSQTVNEVVEEPSTSSNAIEETAEMTPLKTVIPKFTDKITSCSRFNTHGGQKLEETLIDQIQSQPTDSSDRYRKLCAKVREFDINEERDSDFTRAPNPSASPKWQTILPDQKLNREFEILSNRRSLEFSLGPKALELRQTERMSQQFALDQIQKECDERTVKLALPGTNVTLYVGAGGEADIIFDKDCADILVKGMCFNEVRHLTRDRSVETRDFTTYSTNKLSPSDPIATRNTVLSAASVDDARTLWERFNMNGIDAKKIPRDLITGNWNGRYTKRECALELEWERYGTNRISVYFSNLKEQMDLVDEIMTKNSDYFDYCKIKMEENMNRMSVPVPSSPFPVEDDIKFLKNLLEANGVNVTKIFPMRSREGQTIESFEKVRKCKIPINRRILAAAINEGVWKGHHPSNDNEWKRMLEEGRFEWGIEIPNNQVLEYRKTNSATVYFNSFEHGEKIATHMQRNCRANGEERFYLNKEDKKGVFARTKLRYHYNVPVLVHEITKNRLKELDEEWRAASHFSHADFMTEQESSIQWVRIVSDDRGSSVPGFTSIVVEGFPRSRVEKACTELLAVIRGDAINCDDNKEENWLLTGIGRNIADDVAKEALQKNKVLIDFNVLGKEIRLIGEKKYTMDVEQKLRKIAQNKDKHIIRTLVSVRQPHYMNRCSEAIMHFGGMKMMESVIGECHISPCLEDPHKRTLSFEGTVAVFDRFNGFLTHLDDKFRESAHEEYAKKRRADPKLEVASPSTPICPICRYRVDSDYYRLEACGHLYCSTCVYHQMYSNLTARELPVVCKHDGCNRKFAVSDVLRLLLGRDPERSGETGLELLDEIKLRPLVDAIVAKALQTNRNRIFPCQTANCPGIFPSDKDSTSSVHCTSCEKSWCASCGLEPHRGVSCDKYKEIRDNPDASVDEFIKEKKSAQKCPEKSCTAVIEKTEGCNHMECPLCHIHFCWICQFSSYNQGKTAGEITEHLKTAHADNTVGINHGDMLRMQFE